MTTMLGNDVLDIWDSYAVEEYFYKVILNCLKFSLNRASIESIQPFKNITLPHTHTIRFAMPIRVGIIGLSISANAWTSAAHIVPLRSHPSLSSKYTVTALATSTPATATAAAEKWSLPSEKAYSSATDMDADPNIDLVVVGVKVPLHKQLALPALKAGKDVFVEWPLVTGEDEAQELVREAKEGGGRTIVGLQLRCSLTILKVCTHITILLYTCAKCIKAKAIIDSGALGRILSTDILGVDSIMIYFPPAYDYTRDAKNGV